MNKPISNDLGDRHIPLTPPDDFELDEIEWNNNEHPLRLSSIPFENITKQILKELEHD